MVKDKIALIRKNIARICKRVGRYPQDIVLVGVTKFASSQNVQEAIDAGLKHIAENKVQQAQEKFSAIKFADKPVTKHMIGHLQTNKIKQALQLFDLIQSVDSLKLAQAIDRQAQKLSITAKVLIEINISGEKQKHGFEPDKALDALKEISKCENIEVRGVMGMAAHTHDENKIRKSFVQLRKLKEQFAQEFKEHRRINMKCLSMGMTDDYEIAIEEGSNMVRIGRAIFQ